MTSIHYFYDPMCGWCYGATSLINLLKKHCNQQDWGFYLHPGGMIPRREIETSFRQHILQADQRIADLTGATFGDRYRQRVASREPLLLDSLITTQAILAAQTLRLDPLSAIETVQQGHYQQGRDVSDNKVIEQLILQLAESVDIELDASTWQKAFAKAEHSLDGVLQRSHQLMGQLGVQGYPTLLMESAEGWQRLPHSQFYGKEVAWQQWLQAL